MPVDIARPGGRGRAAPSRGGASGEGGHLECGPLRGVSRRVLLGHKRGGHSQGKTASPSCGSSGPLSKGSPDGHKRGGVWWTAPSSGPQSCQPDSERGSPAGTTVPRARGPGPRPDEGRTGRPVRRPRPPRPAATRRRADSDPCGPLRPREMPRRPGQHWAGRAGGRGGSAAARKTRIGLAGKSVGGEGVGRTFFHAEWHVRVGRQGRLGSGGWVGGWGGGRHPLVLVRGSTGTGLKWRRRWRGRQLNELGLLIKHGPGGLNPRPGRPDHLFVNQEKFGGEGVVRGQPGLRPSGHGRTRCRSATIIPRGGCRPRGSIRAEPKPAVSDGRARARGAPARWAVCEP